MAALTQILQAVTTSTGAANSSTFAIDSTVFTKGAGSVDWSISVIIAKLDDQGSCARFSILDSVDNFVTPVAGPTFEITGQTFLQGQRQFSFTRKDFPGLRFGVASAVMRVSLTLLSGTLPHCTWSAVYTGPFSN